MFRTSVWLLGAVLALMGCASRPAPGPATESLPGASIPADLGTVSLRVGLEVVGDRTAGPTDSASRFGALPGYAEAPSGTVWPTAWDDREDEPVRISFARPERSRARDAEGLGFVQHALPWNLDDESLAKVRDRREQTVLRFVDDLLGADRRRVQRQLGAPVLHTRISQSQLPALQTAFDERIAEDQASYDHRVLQSLLKRPLRRAAVRLSILGDFETELHAFKRGNLPTSAEYQEVHGGPSLGRVSMRVRPSRLEDPVELTWIRDGLRLGSSQEFLKLRYTWQCAPNTFASVSWHSPYDHRNDHLSMSLEWRPEPDLILHVLASDRLHFLDGPTAWTGNSSPFDGDGGMLFYVEKMF